MVDWYNQARHSNVWCLTADLRTENSHNQGSRCWKVTLTVEVNHWTRGTAEDAASDMHACSRLVSYRLTLGLGGLRTIHNTNETDMFSSREALQTTGITRLAPF